MDGNCQFLFSLFQYESPGATGITGSHFEAEVLRNSSEMDIIAPLELYPPFQYY